MLAETLNQIIGVKEAWHAPSRLTQIFTNPKATSRLLDQFTNLNLGLENDWLRDYYQLEHSNRKELGQDYTPEGIAQTATRLLPAKYDTCLDMCAGTGTLTITMWNQNPTAHYICEEYSTRAVPFLICNLAMRNMTATIRQGDSLTREFDTVWRLTPGEKYSTIAQTDQADNTLVDVTIMNPPYSLTWTPRPIMGLPAAPKSKADWAFILTGLEQTTPGGQLVAIMPTGVLFRSAAEATIRQHLVENAWLDLIVGMPANTFLHTQIPTCILRFNKTRTQPGIFFINAEKQYTKRGKLNVVTAEHVNKICATATARTNIAYFAAAATRTEIVHHDYNLNIPRFVEPEPGPPPPSFTELLDEMQEIEAQIATNHTKVAAQLDELVTTNPGLGEAFEAFRAGFRLHYQQTKPEPITKPKRISAPVRPARPDKTMEGTLF